MTSASPTTSSCPTAGKKLQLLNSDIHDWNITFVDTGIQSNIGQRLKAVEHYLEGESVFLANYSDGLTDLPLPEYIDHFLGRDKVGSFLAVSPPYSSHLVSFDGRRRQRRAAPQQGRPVDQRRLLRLPHGIFEYMQDGEELVEQPFQRLIEEEQLIASQVRRITGPAWTPSRTGSNSTTCTRAATPPGKCGSRPRTAVWRARKRSGRPRKKRKALDPKCLTCVFAGRPAVEGGNRRGRKSP